MDYEHESETASKRTAGNSDRVEFRPPKEFTVPEGSEAKGEFDLVCTFRVKPDGMLCMTMLGDTKMPGYDDKGEESEDKRMSSKPDYREYASAMASDMEGQTNPQSY